MVWTNPGGQAMSRQAFEEWLKTQPPENWWEVSEAECEGHWIDFNGGGWTWAGMAGTPIGWRALKDEK